MRKTVTLLYCFFLVLPPAVLSQNAPVTTAATVAGAVPGEITVPITVTGFTNIGAISLTLDYDYSVIQFLQGTPNPLLPTFLTGDADLGNGFHRLTMGWYGPGTGLPDGSAIMNLVFTYVNGNTALEWFEDGSSCEYADGQGDVLNDTPASAYYINGYVCGALANPGPISGNITVCQGQDGESYGIDPVANATGYTWTVPDGAAIVSGQNTNAILVDYSEYAVSGMVAVYGLNPCGSGPSSQLPVTVNALPVANAGNDTVIPYGTSATLHAAPGGTGTFSYHWSPEVLLADPDVREPQTVILTSTVIFTVLVTNVASLCQSSDDVIITITGGPLNVNPASIPDELCLGGTAWLFANAGGGSGNYTYAWTCIPPDTPPWTSDLANPQVSPGSSKTYHLSVFDGYTTVTGSTSLTVYQLPTATITGGDSLCGEGASTILTVDLTGTPPWTFYYTTGVLTYLVMDQYTTPYSFAASEPGVYTIPYVSDAHCTGTTYGSAEVLIFPVPPAPVITIYENLLLSSACCGNQWYKDGILIPGATGQTYEPDVNGNYSDIVTLNGCSSDASNEIYFVIPGISRHSNSLFCIEPNPAGDFVAVKSTAVQPDVVMIQIFTVQGKEEEAMHVDPVDGQNNIILNIQHLSPGLYFLVISAKYGKYGYKLIVE
jgi:hypothetical protein